MHTMQNHAMSRKTMQNHAKPCNSIIQHHTTSYIHHTSDIRHQTSYIQHTLPPNHNTRSKPQLHHNSQTLNPEQMPSHSECGILVPATHPHTLTPYTLTLHPHTPHTTYNTHTHTPYLLILVVRLLLLLEAKDESVTRALSGKCKSEYMNWNIKQQQTN
jgi:hypothetical protein